ncbi:phosphoribosylanthranilate isomerase [Haloferax larsenii JCM 13917]|nr:phosphoribosylanthranilate isomerase [Haloferax larsenii]ELZ78310.1 phosphoribosylanthranilate isomerase [Haloferax larsenii JCM 13917]
MVRVKVCGVTRDADLEAVESAGADAVGVIADVSVDTPREVSVARARDLVASAPPFLTTTLVTMPESVTRARDLVREVRPDVLQLHADFSPEELASIREEGVRVVPVVEATDLERAQTVAQAADAILVDTPSESGGGGTGETHDWDASRTLVEAVDAPVILAGGLTPANVAEAVQTVQPDGVDVASGVEASGGVKDHDAVRTFVAEATRNRQEVSA